MTMFTSPRERNLWLLALVVLVAIYATLGVAPGLINFLGDRDLLTPLFILGLVLVVVAVMTQGLRVRPHGVELGLGLGIAAVYLLLFLRMAISEERGHLIEYSVLAIFIYEALRERAHNGRRVPLPALLAIGLTAVLGAVDEGIQYFLPNRVFDYRDIGFNFLAGVLAIGGSLTMQWARRRYDQWREDKT